MKGGGGARLDRPDPTPGSATEIRVLFIKGEVRDASVLSF